MIILGLGIVSLVLVALVALVVGLALNEPRPETEEEFARRVSQKEQGGF